MTEECPVRLPGRGSNSITGLTESSLRSVALLQALADRELIHPLGFTSRAGRVGSARSAGR